MLSPRIFRLGLKVSACWHFVLIIIYFLLKATEEDNSSIEDSLKDPTVSSPTETPDKNIIHINRIEPEAFTAKQPDKGKTP